MYESIRGDVYQKSHSTTLDVCLACGCYEVELEVGIPGCPVVRRVRQEIAVTPAGQACRKSDHQYTFSHPRPSPMGIHGVVGLSLPPYSDNCKLDRPHLLAFSVLVAKAELFCRKTSSPGGTE